MVNIHEKAARALKVAKLLSVIPCGASARQIAQIADFLAALPQSDRNAFAELAGVNPPSETTWAEVVAGARARTAVVNILDRFLPPSNDNGCRLQTFTSKETR